MLKPQKEELVRKLKERMQSSTAVLLSDYAGLTVEQMNKLRRTLRENKIGFLIAKNTLLKRAAESIGGDYVNLADYWKGPTAVAFSVGDPTVTARVLSEFAKDNQKPVFKAAVVDGTLFNQSQVEQLAKMPAKDQLLSQVVGAISSPLTSLVGTLDAIMRELVFTVDAIAKARA